jgi:hypothetical protein
MAVPESFSFNTQSYWTKLMDVLPNSNDAPEVATLKAQIGSAWQDQVRLRKELEQAERNEGNFRAQLRLIQEGLAVGDTILLGPKRMYGSVELSHEAPYLWLREIGANGMPTKRRFKIDTRYERTEPRIAK